jgi:hypothetical protein
VEISQNFVAFSEYMNFIKNDWKNGGQGYIKRKLAPGIDNLIKDKTIFPCTFVEQTIFTIFFFTMQLMQQQSAVCK